MRPAVFLDRDGTLIEERGYLDRLDLLELFPWTVDAIRLLNRAGFAAVVITNQSAIGRGIVDEPFLHRVHEAIDARLALGRARIDAYYFCPHHPDAELEAYRQACRCRKPQPGLVERACRELQLDPSRSVMVGDKWVDVACGRAAGTRTVLVRTGHGAHEEERRPAGASADAILNNLMEAVGWMLRSSSR
jgi:D-glycero-D-manno-heptose 1,7-bisphosphate phosphatase